MDTVDVTTARFSPAASGRCNLLVIMGDPIGVYDAADCPFLSSEIDCIGDRLTAQNPTLGICLGAQRMAASPGARVYPGNCGAEIGWSPIKALRRRRTAAMV